MQTFTDVRSSLFDIDEGSLTIPNELAIDSEIVATYNGGERDSARLTAAMRALIESEPLARVDYVAITDTELLDPVETIPLAKPTLISMAIFIGETRLVDNIVLNGEL